MALIGRRRRFVLFLSGFFLCFASFAHGNNREVGFSAFLDGSWVFPVGLAFYPGVELSIHSLGFQNGMTLTLGAALAGQIAFADRKDLWSFTTFGAAIAPFALLSFDDGEHDTDRFIERLELSLSPGAGFNYYSYSGDPAYTANREKRELGFAMFAGARFRIGRFIALRFDATHWGRYIGPNIALGLQLDLW